MTLKSYRITYTHSSRDDVREIKKYIFDTFKYRELGTNFTKKIKEAAKGLKTLPAKHNTIGFLYRGYKIYLKPYRTYLIFYVINEKKKIVTILRVLQDGMNWQVIIKDWLNSQSM